MDLKVPEGTLLAASPGLLDPNFMHAVVLICQHTGEGAYGVVVNRRAEPTTRQALSEHPVLGQLDFPLFVGGPVGLDSLQVLHCVPDAIPGGVPVLDDLWVGGDLDALAEYVQQSPEEAASKVRLLVGYSGWAAGQLDVELVTGSWLPAAGEARRILSPETDTLWREVVRSLGVDGHGLEHEPPDPHWN
jgi:putative transcriptional regulator